MGIENQKQYKESRVNTSTFPRPDGNCFVESRNFSYQGASRYAPDPPTASDLGSRLRPGFLNFTTPPTYNSSKQSATCVLCRARKYRSRLTEGLTAYKLCIIDQVLPQHMHTGQDCYRPHSDVTHINNT